jgi:thiamine kinase-like enzyme
MTSLNWINDKYFEKVLKQIGVGINIKILNSNVTEASSVNGSTILKAKVQYSSNKIKDETVNFIVKLSSNAKNVFVDNTTFTTEIKMYQTIMEMQRLFETSGENVVFAPRMLYYSQEPVPNVVLEDISAAPKSLVTINERLDFDETKKILLKLARWHAASFQVAKDTKMKLDEYNVGLFNVNSEGVNLIHSNFRLFVDEIKSWTGYEKYAAKLEKLSPKFLKYGKTVYKANGPSDGYNVLNHGDFNYKNMLFKKNDINHKVYDALFLDFQLSIWATPAIDLYSLLYMIASDETRLNHENELLELYYSEFIDTLRRVGLMTKVPTLLEFRVELLKHKFLEVVLAICFLPYFYVDDSQSGYDLFNDANIEQRKNLYKNEAYQNSIKKILPRLLTSGALE